MVCDMVPLFPVVAALLAAAPAADARLAIVEVDAPDTMLGLAGQVTRALLAEAANQKLALVPPDELRTRLQPKALTAARKCGPSVACVAQALEGLGVARAVVGQLGRDEKNYLLRLWYYDLKQLRLIADVDRSILIAARRFDKDLSEAIPRLLRGEREARGTLVIEANLGDAQVSINGEFVGTPTVTQSLKPGKYEVKLERRKYLSITRLLNVDADQETREHFNLLLKPGEVADEAVPALAKHGADGQGGAGVHLSAPTWIFGALTLIGAGGSIGFSLLEQSQERALLNGYDATSQTYAGTRKDALAAQQSALFANIAYGVTGAALIATIAFIIKDATSPVEVAPVVSGGGAGVVVGGHF